MTTAHILRGPIGVPPSSCAMLHLALRMRDHAYASGLVVRGLQASRIPGSLSRYLTLVDARGREWIVSISNHFKPRRTGHPDPHLDLVSRDGMAGFTEACDYVSSIARGDVVHTAAMCSPKRRGQR